MKNINRFVFFYLSVLSMGCYTLIGGYRGGRPYQLINSQKVYFDFSVNKISLTDRPRKDFIIQFHKGDTLISHYGFSDTAKLKNSYELPDSIIVFSKSRKLSILIIVDSEIYYDLFLSPDDWLKKETVYGYIRQYQ